MGSYLQSGTSISIDTQQSRAAVTALISILTAPMAASQRQVCIMARREKGERGSGAIYDPRDNVSDRVVPVHAETGDVGIWWPSVTSGNTKLLYRFTYTTNT